MVACDVAQYFSSIQIVFCGKDCVQDEQLCHHVGNVKQLSEQIQEDQVAAQSETGEEARVKISR